MKNKTYSPAFRNASPLRPADELGFSATNLDSLVGRLLSEHVTYWLIMKRQIKTKDFDLRLPMVSMVSGWI